MLKSQSRSPKLHHCGTPEDYSQNISIRVNYVCHSEDLGYGHNFGDLTHKQLNKTIKCANKWGKKQISNTKTDRWKPPL